MAWDIDHEEARIYAQRQNSTPSFDHFVNLARAYLDLRAQLDHATAARESNAGYAGELFARAEAAEAEVRRMRLECHRIGGDESWGAESEAVGATMRLMAARVLDAGDVSDRAKLTKTVVEAAARVDRWPDWKRVETQPEPARAPAGEKGGT